MFGPPISGSSIVKFTRLESPSAESFAIIVLVIRKSGILSSWFPFVNKSAMNIFKCARHYNECV